MTELISANPSPLASDPAVAGHIDAIVAAARAAQALPQLAAYAGALSAATGRKVTTLAIHLPVAGVVLPFDAGEGWTAPFLATTSAGARE